VWWLLYRQLGSGDRRRVRGEVTVTQTREVVPTASDRRGIASEARWLSIRQIAGDLGVSSATAYKWSARGVPWFAAVFACTTAIFG